MYLVQRLHILDNSFLAALKSVGNTVLMYLDMFSRGIEAARVAQQYPGDRDAVMRILFRE